MGNHDLMISADNKGWASLRFEKLMGTQYAADTGGAPDGRDNFVAAFAQTDEGDSVPDLFVFDKDINGGNGPGEGVPYAQRGGTDEPYRSEEHTSELQSLMRNSYAVFCLKHKNKQPRHRPQ